MVAGATAAWDSRFQGGGVAPHLQSSARIQMFLHPNVAFCATVSGIVALSLIISLSGSMTTALITQTVQTNCLLLRDNSRQVTRSWVRRTSHWSARTMRETHLQAARAGWKLLVLGGDTYAVASSASVRNQSTQLCRYIM